MNQCLCQCGQEVQGKKNYKPGHDAAHVSHLLHSMKDIAVEEGHPGLIKMSELRALSKELPSEALQEKLRAAVERYNSKPAKKSRAKKSDSEQVVHSHEYDAIRYKERQDVKVGRWYYPSRVAITEIGEVVERNEKRDGSGGWVPVV